MLHAHGLMVLPRNPKLQLSDPVGKGRYYNFVGLTQGRTSDWHQWDFSLWVPLNKVDEWAEKLKPESVFYIEHAQAHSVPTLDGKYHNTRIRLDHNKLKRMETPLWIKD